MSIVNKTMPAGSQRIGVVLLLCYHRVLRGHAAQQSIRVPGAFRVRRKARCGSANQSLLVE